MEGVTGAFKSIHNKFYMNQELIFGAASKQQQKSYF